MADLGRMPDVARLLRPLRPDISAFGDARFDGNRWMARLDDLPSTSWDNSHAGQAFG